MKENTGENITERTLCEKENTAKERKKGKKERKKENTGNEKEKILGSAGKGSKYEKKKLRKKERKKERKHCWRKEGKKEGRKEGRKERRKDNTSIKERKKNGKYWGKKDRKYEEGNLQSSLLWCGTRPNEWGTSNERKKENPAKERNAEGKKGKIYCCEINKERKYSERKYKRERH